MASDATACAARVMAWVVWLPPEGQVHGRFFDVLPQVMFALFPGHAEKFGNHAMHVGPGFRSQIADAGLDIDPAIGLDDEQAVKARGAAGVATDRYADAAHLRAVPLAGVPTFRSFHLNCSEPRSSASLMNALVAYCCLPATSGPNRAFPSGEFMRRMAT